MKHLLLILLSIPFVAGAQDEPDSLHDRRYYDSLGKHWMIEYSYVYICDLCPVPDKGATISNDTNTPIKGIIKREYGRTDTLFDLHIHYPATITIIEYKGRNYQRVVWEGKGLYSEHECASDNPRLWINRYLNKQQ